jgi:hypothetical protein
VFNPSLADCKDAVAAEQQIIDTARKGLTKTGWPTGTS